MREQVIQAIYLVIDEVNGQFPKEQRLNKSEDTVLVGPSSRLNSLGVISFIVATEQKIEGTFGKQITLTDERALSLDESPFRNVGMLAEYITELIESDLEI